MSATKPRILVAGVGPVPPERPDHLFAPGLRVWGIARELAHAGHPVRLVCARFGETGDGGAVRYDLEPAAEPTLAEGEELTTPERGGWGGLLAAQIADFGPAAAIGSTDLMNHALATADPPVPLWMDYFGDPMAERQMLALREDSDQGLADQWTMVAPALARADRVSGCSADQCAALLGQLGVVGRLNRHTVREPLVHCLPPWIEPIPMDMDAAPLVRGVRTPKDAFIVIQTGGFNTWLDVETLFAGLEIAMAANPRIHFAATGGAIAGHHGQGFARFKELVAQSPYGERFHLLGWLPLGQVPQVIQEGDVGLNVDLFCTEGRLGTRNRLLDWLLGGLPAISTPGCELALELDDEGLIQLIPHDNPKALAQAIFNVATDAKGARNIAESANKYLRETHAAEICLRPLLNWANAPKPASDLHRWKSGTEIPPALLIQARDGARAMRESQQQAQKLAWLERRLARLEGSRLVRWALALRGRRDLDADRSPEEL